ncbi:MAG: 2-octaprenyl-6-methoxyphenol hydroxylase [Thiomicrorhabdus sp.]|nr:MAG: 2-octaprenyl-6-methoxyphenol hydroxylase [Thiomicrorhabdus sp.]
MQESIVKEITSDVVIAGGGPVGLMLALGLTQQGYKVILAEAYEPAEDAPNSFDGRVLALSHGSIRVFQRLNIWQDLVSEVTEIHHVHVSQKGYLGITKLHAEEVDVPALGYSIQSSDLGRVLWQHVKQNDAIQVLCPARLVDFTEQDSGVVAQVEVAAEDNAAAIQYQINAKLVVGADGTDSQVRKILLLPLEEKSYSAFGVIAQIETEKHPENWSYERFTEEGPVALLPMKGHFHKAVLVCPQEDIDRVKNLNDDEFIDLFASKMGERLGAFTSISPRVIYPLKETYVEQMAKGRAVLMGNASHTQHPVAAQGLNLGIRDVEVFLELNSSPETVADIGNVEQLAEYAELRKPDHEKVMGLTDGLIQIFQHQSPIVGHLRGVGLMAMQAMPSLKRRFSRFAMGGGQS